MAIAVTVPAAVVVATVVWWLRRDRTGADAGDGFAAGPPEGRDLGLGLAPEAEAAFLEGLSAYHDAGGALRADWERGVLTAAEPSRPIPLPLLAGEFAALGDAALHDPQSAVAGLLGAITAERPESPHQPPQAGDPAEEPRAAQAEEPPPGADPAPAIESSSDGETSSEEGPVGAGGPPSGEEPVADGESVTDGELVSGGEAVGVGVAREGAGAAGGG
ncbi:hypothetical protein MF672_021695 [Actinomadura sp. ATCC 31491]|uniref:Uncharacterized protein n=1 Tax=Actinomadura luzonensis TaxID=2805427 RepID=A0ABT0FVN4_9ACTN|nr:hypothetical protein [Actinomadura luzonensis]MCK2216394.1 hypothetical protein [Actinomadura luzonensis]